MKILMAPPFPPDPPSGQAKSGVEFPSERASFGNDRTLEDDRFEWRGLLLRAGRDWDFGSQHLLADDGGDRHQYGEHLSIKVWERWLNEGWVDQAEVQDAWQAMDWPNDPDNALDKEQWIILFKAASFPVPDEPIPIYRAEAGPEGAVGLCWTDDLGRAEAWASRHQDTRGSHGRSRILSAIAQPGQM